MDTHDQPNIDTACGQSSDSADKLRTCSDCQNDLICHDQGECLRRKVSTINDGGPAFPNNDAHGCAYAGMTLRDWFAGMALQGQAHRFGNPYDAREILAQDCYDIADAMLEAREVKP